MLLFLSDIAGSEIMLILLVVLIFFGPKSIPGIAKTFGKTIYQIKQASDDLKSEISKTGADIKKDMNLDGIFKDPSDRLEKEIMNPIQREINEVDKSLHSISYDRKIPAEEPEVLAENIPEETPIEEEKTDEA